MNRNDHQVQRKRYRQALKILGFNMRDLGGSKGMYCIHGITKDKLRIPKVDEGVSEDVLVNLLGPLGLSIDFFRSAYTGLTDVNKYPRIRH